MSTDSDLDPATRPVLRLVDPTDSADRADDPAPGPDGPADAETYTEPAAMPGAPVDAADVGVGFSWADPQARAKRLPLLPGWLASRDTITATVRAAADVAWYHLAFHGLRSPVYAVKTLWYAPIGVLRTVGRLLHWASAERHNFGLRQHAADHADAYTWQALNRTRSREARGRWWAVAALVVAVLATVVLLRVVAPGWAWWPILLGSMLTAARAGRPADAPITVRVSTGPRFTKLTAEMVRNAMVALRLPGLTDPSHVTFPQEIHRDGPGFLARLNLPAGLEAVRVIGQRGALSSALRLPIDQVWPTAGPDHAGQVDLWVGYRPVSAMGAPKWSLATGRPTSVFDEHEFGTDERQRPVRTALSEFSFLLGGRPGSGKTYAAKAVATLGLLDPTCELKVAEFKGTGDFIDWEPLCSSYVVGVDDDAFRQGAAILAWALGEAERRGKRILAAKRRGEAPHGKVTPELSRRPGSGLHPVMLVFDEVHELFAAVPQAAEDCERLIKRARALNMIVVLATQIPDRNSLPPNITRCVTHRWCLSVAGQMENDLILGTGAYKRGLTGTAFRPGVDAGWGCMTGGPTPQTVRSHFPDPTTAGHIVSAATALRGGTVVGASLETAPARDLLADLTTVSATKGQHWATAVVELVERWPEAYPALSVDALAELARAHGVASTTIAIAGKRLKGYRLDAIRDLIAARPTD